MIKRFDLYLNTVELGLMHIADVALLKEQGAITSVGLRYTANYLAHPHAFAIDPAQLPLSHKEFSLPCKQAAPAFIDDTCRMHGAESCLPGWPCSIIKKNWMPIVPLKC